jgi:hypothetical protein
MPPSGASAGSFGLSPGSARRRAALHADLPAAAQGAVNSGQAGGDLAAGQGQGVLKLGDRHLELRHPGEVHCPGPVLGQADVDGIHGIIDACRLQPGAFLGAQECDQAVLDLVGGVNTVFW